MLQYFKHFACFCHPSHMHTFSYMWVSKFSIGVCRCRYCKYHLWYQYHISISTALACMYPMLLYTYYFIDRQTHECMHTCTHSCAMQMSASTHICAMPCSSQTFSKYDSFMLIICAFHIIQKISCIWYMISTCACV